MSIEELKAKVPGITDIRLLEDLLAKGSLVQLKAGQAIIEPGKFIKMVPIILEGAIKVLRLDDEGRELFLYYLNSGQTCALSLTCCNSLQPSEIKAVAEEDSLVLSIPIRYHEQLLEQYRQWKDFVAQTYQQRFQEMLEALDAVAFLKMDQRLVRYLQAKRKQLSSNELQITHQEIAQELGTSREVVSRLLKQLEKKKWIELGRNKIFMRDNFEDLVGKS
ncbi:Crp/Fnr family transcriptional regulator [Echinicola jeungdonensis]|uniref:Crp/Fnr family transcriptional regulator n=1 Tax=Echinicola jeungdonensis TaxID=709343 RepID=A0ABV5J491_9BACT|nr:Crp/Fnr family transcriptional regulator [Echinicola jeungdonensis]MDN3670052.1 Crp/Fnr family transcriptional regulator [Echinicola jeungdonensis]